MFNDLALDKLIPVNFTLGSNNYNIDAIFEMRYFSKGQHYEVPFKSNDVGARQFDAMKEPQESQKEGVEKAFRALQYRFAIVIYHVDFENVQK